MADCAPAYEKVIQKERKHETLRLGLNQFFFEFPYEFRDIEGTPAGANYFLAKLSKINILDCA